eukprot:CAMPEP_0115231778 /NCGR_PEP_ID=MMETSP0270-20121206/33415_1 /TAXON_ID=71861 /ORGANISM="Scrippsiella trochoidea, Strain CCMP3099" /LENGTH=215 /DNA_ID=CAMNT_0002646429 /DNA_START=42 /DNA_END=689 /DNA_ORIENTATION=-
MQTERLSRLAALGSVGSVVRVSMGQLRSDMLGAHSPSAIANKPLGSPPASPHSSIKAALAPLHVWGSSSEDALAKLLTRADLLGCWVDSIGNFVLVRSADLPGQELTAMLVKPWAENIILALSYAEDIGTWSCGSAALDLSRSSSKRLVWVSPEGHQVVWTWRAFTLEALEARGMDFVKEMACSEAEYRASPPSTPGSESSSQQWVPVCVHVGLS